MYHSAATANIFKADIMIIRILNVFGYNIRLSSEQNWLMLKVCLYRTWPRTQLGGIDKEMFWI